MTRKPRIEGALHAHEWNEAGDCACGAHDPLERAVRVTIVDNAPPAVDYAALLKELVDMHELEGRASKSAADVPYGDLRKIRREAGALWGRARAAIYGEPAVDNQPRNKAEAERWQRNEGRVAASRAQE